MARPRIAAAAVLAGLSALPAAADLCSVDFVPAATLLLPYFELDPTDPNGRTTVLSINNASPLAALGHLTLWTDWAVPTLHFDVYLTGYDVQTINLRDLFQGRLPVTAPPEGDPADTISPRGSLSEDVSFAGCELYLPLPAQFPFLAQELTRAHQGLESPVFGGCVAHPIRDSKVRGYVTIDAVHRCANRTPADPEYWRSVASDEGQLWGTYFVVDPAENSAQQETLVHIEACPRSNIQPSPDLCGFRAPDATFYGRYSEGRDRREPLPTTYAVSYLNGGSFQGQTRLTIWRDTMHPGGVSGACGNTRPAWWPLDLRESIAFDEEENAESLCGPCPVCSPPVDLPCYTLATQAVSATEPEIGNWMVPSIAAFGWWFLNLSPPVVGAAEPRPAQGWVTAFTTASNRFSIATDAIALDRSCSPDAGSLVVEP